MKLSALAIANREPWQLQALCIQADPEAFFPDNGGCSRVAKRVCAQCPVARECLAFALKRNERWGVWGGLTEHERRGLRRGGKPPTRRPECGTEAGLSKHYKRNEPTCQPCRDTAAARSRTERARRRSGEDRQRSLSQNKHR